MVHRDFIYNKMDPFSQNNFHVLSSYVSRELYTRLEKTVNKYRVSSFLNQLRYLRGGNFFGQKVLQFSHFWHFSRKFLPRHNLNSKFVNVFAPKITENSQHVRVSSIQFCFASSIFCVVVP